MNNCQIIYKDIKKMYLRIKDNKIVITCPKHTSKRTIENFIRSNQDWIQKRMNENLTFRQEKQPSLTLPNCGSVFKNPEGDSAGRLLEAAGAKQMKAGGARVFEKHANFIINDNNATSSDILILMDKMSSAVENKYGIKLIPEVRYLGNNNEKEVELCRKLKMESIKIQK